LFYALFFGCIGKARFKFLSVVSVFCVTGPSAAVGSTSTTAVFFLTGQFERVVGFLFASPCIKSIKTSFTIPPRFISPPVYERDSQVLRAFHPETHMVPVPIPDPPKGCEFFGDFGASVGDLSPNPASFISRKVLIRQCICSGTLFFLTGRALLFFFVPGKSSGAHISKLYFGIFEQSPIESSFHLLFPDPHTPQQRCAPTPPPRFFFLSPPRPVQNLLGGTNEHLGSPHHRPPFTPPPPEGFFLGVHWSFPHFFFFDFPPPPPPRHHGNPVDRFVCSL